MDTQEASVDRVRMCDRKVRHKNEVVAWEALQSLVRANKAGDTRNLGIYECPFKTLRQHWHIGHHQGAH